MKKLILFSLLLIPSLSYSCVVNNDGSHDCQNQPRPETIRYKELEIKFYKEYKHDLKVMCEIESKKVDVVNLYFYYAKDKLKENKILDLRTLDLSHISCDNLQNIKNNL